jgi:hypothetical protein
LQLRVLFSPCCSRQRHSRKPQPAYRSTPSDADSLDFLGEIGAARMLSLTGEGAEGFARAVKALRSFVRDIPPRLITKTAQNMGAERVAALEHFLDALQAQTFNGEAM